MKAKQLWRFIWIVVIISLLLGILIHFDKILSFLVSNAQSLRISQRIGVADTVSDVFITSAVAFISFLINYYVLHPFNSKIIIDFRRFSIAVILTIVAVMVFSELFFSLKHMSSDFNERPFRVLYTFRDILIVIIVIAGVYFIKTYNDRQEMRIENEKLKNEKLLSQYESLKNQVSPHFFFNSLTALKELISQDPRKAQEYINHLSSVMRYTLQSNQYNTQSLYDELQIADSYLFLAKIRFGNNLVVHKNVTPEYYQFLLPPMAIQILIENAIKHNEISKRNSLEIEIMTTPEKTIKVINNLNEKRTPEVNTGTGLLNLSRQYRFLAGKDILITKGDDKFIVEIPLLTHAYNEGSNS